MMVRWIQVAIKSILSMFWKLKRIFQMFLRIFLARPLTVTNPSQRRPRTILQPNHQPPTSRLLFQLNIANILMDQARLSSIGPPNRHRNPSIILDHRETSIGRHYPTLSLQPLQIPIKNLRKSKKNLSKSRLQLGLGLQACFCYRYIRSRLHQRSKIRQARPNQLRNNRWSRMIWRPRNPTKWSFQCIRFNRPRSLLGLAVSIIT